MGELLPFGYAKPKHSSALRTRWDEQHKRKMTVICCDTCEAQFERFLRQGMNHRPFYNSARSGGWVVDDRGNSATCPKCKVAGTSKDEKVMQTESAAVIRGKMQMMAMLTEHFEGRNGVYADGWSDKIIAEKSGVNIAVVSEWREAAFGPVRDPALIEAQKRVDEVRRRFAEDLAKATGLLEGIKSEMTRQLAELEKKVSLALNKAA